MKRVIVLMTVSVVTVFLCRTGNALDIFLGTSRSGFEKIPITLLHFESEKENEERALLLETILARDLVRSQLFRIVRAAPSRNVSSGPPDMTQIVSAEKAGVQVIAWGKLIQEGEKWILESVAYETQTRERIVGIRIVGEEQSIQILAHRFSNKLVSILTGEVGIAESKIAYTANLTGKKEIFLVDYDGANEIRLTGDRSIALFPRWSYNGSKIYYTSFRSGHPRVYSLDLQSGEKMSLFAFSGTNFSPMSSPTGEKLVFALTKDGNGEIYTSRPDGSGLQRLTHTPQEDLSPTWSRTGQEIAFVSDRTGKPQIYLMNQDGSNVHRLTFNGTYNTSPSWSPDGDWIAYTCRNEEKWLKLCLIRPDGTGMISLTQGGAWDDESPSWSPNGREIAFSSNEPGKYHIFSIRRDGTGRVRLTFTGASHKNPSWSPDPSPILP